MTTNVFFVCEVVRSPFERDDEKSFIICERSEIKRRRDVKAISVAFKSERSAKSFAKKLVGRLLPKAPLFLDFFEDENAKTVWCWKDERTGGASQIFRSEKRALEGWRRDRLELDKLLD